MSEPTVIAKVIPLVRLPRSLTVFDYRVPNELAAHIQIGTAVFMPFRGRTEQGIVAALSHKSEYPTANLQAITKLAHPDPLASPIFLSTLIRLAEEHCVSPGLFLRSVLPQIPRRTAPRHVSEPRVSIRGFTIPKPFVPKISEALSAVGTQQPLFMLADDSRLLAALFVRLGMDAHRLKRPLRILAPLREDVLTITHLLNQYGIPATRVLPTDNKTKHWELWQASARGELPVLVGTRAAVFFPTTETGTTFLIDHDLDDWKQADINPRYDGRRIISRITSHQIIRVAPIITPEDDQTIREIGLRIVDLRTHAPASVTVANFADHIRSGARTVISDQLAEKLEETQKSLLFVHRKGAGAVLLCKDCRHTFRCSVCNIALSVHRSFLRCPACETKTDLPLTCPECRSASLVQFGIGAERVEEELKIRFSKKRIVRIDRDTMQTTSLPIGTQFETADIVLGTVALLRFLGTTKQTLPPFDLVGVVEMDTMLQRQDFRATEKAASILARLAAIAGRSHASMMMQTAFSDLPLWRIPQGDHASYLDAELAERRSLHYPPFFRLAKILVQHPDEMIVESEAQKIRDALQKVLISHSDVELIGPYPATPPKVRGNFRRLLVVRFPHERYPDIRPHLTTLPDDVIVDLDPISIL